MSALAWVLVGALAVVLVAWFFERRARIHADERADVRLAHSWAAELERVAAEKQAQVAQAAAAAAAAKPESSDADLEKDMNR